MKKHLLKPIFIGGTGRSGTTILKKVLQQHSEIVTIPNELRVIVDPDGVLDLFSALTERWSVNRADVAIHRFDSLVSKCRRATFMHRVVRKLERHKIWPLTTLQYYGILSGFGDEFVRSRTKILMRELIEYQSEAKMIHIPAFRLRYSVYESGPFDIEELSELLQCYVNDLYINVRKRGATCWLDDTPLNILHADELAKVFENMKLIHIYRDPRDVVSSYITQRWGGEEWETVARRVAQIYRQWHQVKTALPNEQYIEVSLEELSANPRLILQKICDHVGIEFEEGLLDIELNKTRSGRWKEDIPLTALDSVLSHLNPILSKYAPRE